MNTDTRAAAWAVPRHVRRRRAGRRAALTCAFLLFAGLSVVLGCRTADTDGVTPVPQLLAFLPWLLIPLGVALVIALYTHWWSGVLWAVVLLGLLAWFLQPYGRTGDPVGPAVAELRVLTSNVEFGKGTGALVGAVRREKPDLVFVQECESTCATLLRAELGGTYPHRRAVEGDGSKGSVILSRFPLTSAKGVEATLGMPAAVAEIGGLDVRLQLAHPMPPLPGQTGVWARELDALHDVVARDDKTPTLVAGDFNASQDHAAFRPLLDAGLRDAARLAGSGRTPSWPAATLPAFGAQIDHVLVSEDFTSRDARFLDLDGTDHRALLVDLTLGRAG
ncbi:endonuclease/exonuclease/phosphatase family protein [Streptomyces griseoviridis]|uniref:Membrane protein n=1 Tax=Streptomyces griseoviridis TaxID=45398 RepID=A0A918GGV5_STRGD|nr:membrane protein [Streptomyces niveoruber]